MPECYYISVVLRPQAHSTIRCDGHREGLEEERSRGSIWGCESIAGPGSPKSLDDGLSGPAMVSKLLYCFADGQAHESIRARSTMTIRRDLLEMSRPDQKSRRLSRAWSAGVSCARPIAHGGFRMVGLSRQRHRHTRYCTTVRCCRGTRRQTWVLYARAIAIDVKVKVRSTSSLRSAIGRFELLLM